MRKGFTIVEMSIVIVVITLIIAGILTGQKLIKLYQMHSIVLEYNQIQSYVNAFYLKFGTVPGDFKKASSVWGTTCDATPTNCDGNGDSLIDLNGTVNTNESFRAWQHLSLAGIFVNSFTGLGSGASNNVGVFTPNNGNTLASKYEGGGYTFTEATYPSSFAFTGATYNGGYRTNWLILGAYISGWSKSEAPLFRSQEANSIDTKIDDGKPASGNVVSYPFANCMTSADIATSTYRPSTNALACNLYLRLSNTP